ncbi:MAG TPA: hypothetical protein VIY30_02550 [Burkholderiaceae bacterium]
MFTRSTLPTLAAIVLLACGSRAGAEAFDPNARLPDLSVRQAKSLSSNYALRTDLVSLRSVGRDAIEPWQPASSALRAEPAASRPDVPAGGAARAGGRLSFNRAPEDERAGSSASITLGRLNLSEPRSGVALGATPQADLDRELAQLRDSVNRVRVVPQVSLGMRVKF